MFKKILNIGVILYVFSSSAMATPINLALDGTASQSSTYFYDYFEANPSNSGDANRAIDGEISPTNATTSHTYWENGAWWQVDLGQVHAIDKIDLWNRQNCCLDRLSDFTVSVLDNNASTVWSTFFSGPASAHEEFDLSLLSIVGQTVKVQLSGTNYLHLAEVQVFGNQQTSPVPVPASMWLFATGLLGVFSFKNKPKTNQLSI